MSIGTIYVRAASKAALNRLLRENQNISGRNFDRLCEESLILPACPAGTVVKIFDHYVGGQPFAKAYGNVAFKPDGSVFVK